MSEYTREEILKLIEENGGPEGLDLSGKDLTGIDLSRDTIQAELALVREGDSRARPKWVSPTITYGINLRRANLQEADVSEANLQGAYLRQADLQEARLVLANLQGTDLGSVNLRGANLERANLQRANLGRANLRGARLVLTNLQEATPVGANLRGARLQEANLQGARLGQADLQGANLERANLQGANLELSKLQEANLERANLQRVRLAFANLQGANLRFADLREVDLIDVRTGGLLGIKLYRAKLDHTALKREQLGPAIGDEEAGEYREARDAYLALKQNFDDLGDYAASSWAYRKERRMEKLEALQRGKKGWQEHDWKGAIPHYAKVAGDQLVEWICDYGEGIWRVAGSLIAVWVAFALIYGLIAGVWGPWQDTGSGKIRYITRNLIDLLSFSLGAMTTIEPPGLEARPILAMRFLAPLEALLGIFFAGLLGFVAGNRIRRS